MTQEQRYVQAKITPEAKLILNKLAKKRKQMMQDYLSDLVMVQAERDELLKIMAPNLEMLKPTPEAIHIRDHKRDRTAEVVMKDGVMQCYLCESNDCPHIHFVLLSPELAQLRKKPH